MEIGPALAEARTKAGLTVADVSERTRIRRAIISDIERDDYTACGGDFYARGHIRAIAKVVGTDPVRLIDEYDENVAARSSQEPQPPPDPKTWWQAAVRHDPHGWRHAAGLPAQEPQAQPLCDLPPVTQPQSAVPPVTEWSHGDATREVSAEADGRSAARIHHQWPEQFRGAAVRQAGADLVQSLLRMRTAGRRLSWITGAIVILLAGLIAAIYFLVSGPGPSASHAAVTPKHAITGIRPARTVRTARSGSVRPSVRPSVQPSTQPSTQPSQRAVPVTPVSAAAFGPGGTGQGDNPQLAALAIGARGGSGWQTNWYTTAKFGGLQAGTGLLLDLGKPVTVSSVRIVLGPASGGTLELRAGNVPVLADLRPVSRTAGTGGTLTLDPRQPVRARYLLLWFTRLPPDSSGTYQATIYHVSLTGTG